MAALADLMKSAIRWALFFMALGQLPQATAWLVREAAQGPQLVSLGRLNCALSAPTGRQGVRHGH